MQKSTFHRFSISTLTCACAAVLLTACGGGGGSADTPVAQSSLASETTQGTATVVALAAPEATDIQDTAATSMSATPTMTANVESSTDASANSVDGTVSAATPVVNAEETNTAAPAATPTTVAAATPTPAPAPVSTPAPAPAPAAMTPYGQDANAYKLTFSEEFNSYNTNLWNDHMWYETSNATKNYTVEDGKLKIWPQRDASGKFFNRTVDTDGKYYQTYGYFEIEAKLPVGKGTWPAFWLFNHIDHRRPEMDVMEAYAGGAAPWGFNVNGIPHPQAYAPTVWKGDQEGQLVGSRQYDTGMDLSAGIHKYAVKWEPNKQTYYLDGKEVLTLNVSMGDPM